MAQKENARFDTGAVLKFGGFEMQYNSSTTDTQAAARAIEAGLICLPDVRDLAFILRSLGLRQRIWLTTGSIISLPLDVAEQIAKSACLGIIASRNGPVAADAERQRRRWVNYCASKTPSERRRGGGR